MTQREKARWSKIVVPASGILGTAVTVFTFSTGIPSIPHILHGAESRGKDESAAPPRRDPGAQPPIEVTFPRFGDGFADAFRQAREHEDRGEYTAADSILLSVEGRLAATRRTSGDLDLDSLSKVVSALRAEVRRACETEVILAVDRGDPAAVSCKGNSMGGVHR